MYIKKYPAKFAFFIPFFILIFLILIFANQLQKKNPRDIFSPLVGKAVPHFNLSALLPLQQNVEKTITEKIFLGHDTLLVVWSSWCESCAAEQAILMQLKKNPHLQLVGLNYRDKKETAKHWLYQHGNPYHTIIYDPKGFLSIHLGVYGVPESFLIDKKGIIQKKIIGPLSQLS